MKSILTKLTTAALSLAALLITGSAWAATPVAVWDGDLTDGSVKGDWTLHYNGNEAADGGAVRIKSGNTKGLHIQKNSTASWGTAATIIVEYADYTPSANDAMIDFGGNNGRKDVVGSNYDYIGAYANTQGKCYGGVWNNNVYSGASEAATAVDPAENQSGRMALIYQYANTIKIDNANFHTALIVNGQVAYRHNSLAGSSIYVGNIGIGGKYYATTGNPTISAGMVIKKVAIFDSSLTPDEVAAYKFPTKWIGEEGEEGNWSEAANWSNGVPAANQVAVIPAGAVVNVDTDIANCTIFGGGRLVYVGKEPGNESASFRNATWTGTVELKDYAKPTNTNYGIILFANYANADSTVALNNVTSTIYTGSAANPVQKFGTLEICAGGWKNASGSYTESPRYECNLTGSGTITITQGGNGTANFVGDHSNFKGSIISGSDGKHVYLLPAGASSGSRTNGKMLTIANGAVVEIAKGTTWQAANGFVIAGTISGSGTLQGNTTFNNGTYVASSDGALAITGNATGTGVIDATAIVEAGLNGAVVMTASGTKSAAFTVIGASGYEAYWNGNDLVVVKSTAKEFYSKWANAQGVLTYMNGTLSGGSKWKIFNTALCEDEDTEIVDNVGSTLIPGYKGTSINLWEVFCGKYKSPGYVIRFASDYTGVAMGGNFFPFKAGGIIVEKGATGYSMTAGTSATRTCFLGDADGVVPMWTVINEDFTFSRGGRAQDTLTFVGNVHIEVASGKTFTINNGSKLDTSIDTSLVMHGDGKITFSNGITASGATLNYSNLELNRATPFIKGNLTVDKDTTFMFPEGFEPTSENPDSSFKLCDGTISGPEKIVGANIYVGGVKLSGKELVFDLQNGKVSYRDITAQRITVTEDISITDIEDEVPDAYTGIVELDFESDGLALVIDKAIPFSNIILECDGLVTLAAEDADDAYVPVEADFNKINWNDVSVANKRIYRNIAPFGTAPTAGMTYRYEGTKTLAAIPFVGSAYEGVVDVACGVAGSEGSVSVTGSKSMSFSDGASYETPSFVLGNQRGVSQSFTQNGGTLEFTKTGSGTSTSSAFVLGHWPSTVTYNLVGGTIAVPDDNTVFGWDGTAMMTIGGDTSTAKLTTKGISTGQGDNANTLTIGGNGTLSIGSYGANLKGSTTVTLNGGTLEAYDTGTFAAANANGIQLAADSTINVAENKVLTITSSFSGSGSITKTGAGTLKLKNGGYLYGSQNSTATPFIITGGTLDLNNAYTWSGTDGSGFLTQKPITLGGVEATTITGGNVTFYGGTITDSIIYNGGDGANAPAEFAANWHGSYSNDPRTRNINVGDGAGTDYDLLISGAIGLSGAQFNGTTIHKTGVGTAMMTGAFNIPTLSIDAGTWKMGAANAVATTTTVGASGTLDVNGQTATVATLTNTGTISSDTPATINITSSANISGNISGVTLVSQGGTITVTDAAEIGEDVKFVVDLDEAVIGSTPFTFTDDTLYSKVETKGDGSLSYDAETHTIVYGGKKLSDTMIWLPIGDSITEGEQYMGHPNQGNAETRGGYRYQLYSQLTDAGMSVRSVGYRTGHMATVESDDCPWAWHAAQYGGVIAHDSNGSHGGALFDVENTLQVAGYPDVITILLGVNDLSMGNPTAANIYDSMDAMVKKIAMMRPNSKILVSTLLPAGGSRGYIDTYNTLLRERSAEDASPFNLANVKLIDVNEKFGPYNAAYFKSDSLHPNENGSIRVAKSFMGFMATAIGEIVDSDTKMVHVHNGESGKIIVRFSKALADDATATLTIAGTDVDGNAVDQAFENGAVDATDKRVMRFEIPQGTMLKGGVYTATLSEIDTTPLSSDFVEIQGTGAAANIDAAYRDGFLRYGTVTFADGTITTEGIGLGDNWNGTGPTIAVDQADVANNEIKRVGYYLELKRANEPSQFVWVSMDAFNTSLSNLLVPTVAAGAHKAKVTNLQVYANRANVTNTAIDNGVVDTTQTGVVEFTPWSWTGNEQGGYHNDIYSNRTGWNDTLETAAGTLKGGMQVFRYTGEETVDTYTKFAAETVFAVNNFNCDTAMDLGIGSFSTHRSNAGGSAAIDCTWDWSNFVSLSKYTKFAVNAYEVKKMEIWVVPMTKIVWTGGGDDNNWNTQGNWNTGAVPTSYSDVEIPAGATIELNSDITIASLTVADASASITGTGSIKITNIAASTLKGTATIVFDGSLPEEAVRTQLQSADWKGTAWIKNISPWNNFDFGSYGHAGSKIKATGITGYGPNSTGGGVNPELILEDVGDAKAISITDGYGGKDYFFSKVSGRGTFAWDSSLGKSPAGPIYIFKDVSSFDGVLDAGPHLKIVVGNTTAGTDKGSITFADGIAVKAGLGWKAEKAYFGATLTVNGALDDVLVSGLTAAPTSLPGLIDAATGNASTLALKYEAGVGGAPNVIKLVNAGAQIVDPTTGETKSYDSIEDAINNESTADKVPTIKVVDGAASLAIENIAAGKAFKVDDDTKAHFDWTETSGKYLALTAAGLTVKAGAPTNKTFEGEEYATKKLVALGLDASNEADKPYIKAAEQTVTGKIKFNFFHGTAGAEIAPTGIGGKTVKYAVLTADSPTAKDWTQPEGAESTDGAVTVDLPQPEPDNSKVRYYKPKFTVE